MSKTFFERLKIYVLGKGRLSTPRTDNKPAFILFEDDELYIKSTARDMEAVGFRYTGGGSTMDQSFAFIKNIVPGRISIAVVDGNIDEVNNQRDGAILIELIKRMDPGILTVGYTNGTTVAGAEINIQKHSFDEEAINRIILPRVRQ